ncbi:hypothetical protein SAMN05216327_109202 [Dyadobacter sp. SG02]|uniref:hypothetical protein n=1 Tax=Dyadobacter sp. SG02 TaxID=1855291 RepID=UPI0008D5AE96|nr:hypothetical protein [Dyadobacter sp. SG02]SEJ39096.1 hypothetical protein SAMN05216327_109202 [Dyadobacter sp. SG02]
MKTFLTIDSTSGGNGDVWMRLLSFYVTAEMVADYNLRIIVPAHMGELAEFAFADLITIVTDQSCKADITYTHLGIRDLAMPILRGNRFVSPYQRLVIHDKKKKELKDYINTGIFHLADKLGIVQIPDAGWMSVYQGFSDIVGIRQLKHITYGQYTESLLKHSPLLLKKFSSPVPVSSQLFIPEDLHKHILFFPNGTSRQFVPLWWALKNMPDAYYGFFERDKDAASFEKAGLRTVRFYEPGDIISLAHAAKWTISTDSFPSHLLQTASTRSTIVLTEAPRSRIISPAFKGKVVTADAICHPCLHMARDLHPLCAAGYKECINWQKNTYTAGILQSALQTAGIS